MIQQQTVLQVADNSGAKRIKCIKVLKNLKKHRNLLGSEIKISVKELRNKSRLTSKVLKGNVFSAVIIRTKKKKSYKDGSYFSFLENSAVLINNQKKLLGTRIIGPVPKILRKHKILKMASLSTGFC